MIRLPVLVVAELAFDGFAVKEAGDVDKTFFWPIIIQRTKVFLEAYAIPSQKTHRKMGVHVLVSMVTEQIY